MEAGSLLGDRLPALPCHGCDLADRFFQEASDTTSYSAGLWTSGAVHVSQGSGHWHFGHTILHYAGPACRAQDETPAPLAPTVQEHPVIPKSLCASQKTWGGACWPD